MLQVATCTACDETFSDDFIVNLSPNLDVKILKIGQLAFGEVTDKKTF